MVDRDQDGNIKKKRDPVKWFDELMNKVPGLATYRGREKLRDQDKLLRDHTVARLGEVKTAVNRIKQAQAAAAKLDGLMALDNLTSVIDRIANKQRNAAYGFSGLFDANKVEEDELGMLYEEDAKILKMVEDLVQKADQFSAFAGDDQATKAGVAGMNASLEELEKVVNGRRDVIRKIDGQAL